MKQIAFLGVCLTGLAVFCQADSAGQASDPKKAEKKIEIFCPVVGLPQTKTCPCVTGGYCSLQPRKGLTADYKGGKLLFCCDGCTKEFKKTPDKFAVAANHQLVATGQAKQEKCPLCGAHMGYVEPLSVAGVSVSFCSRECLRKVAGAKPAEQAELVFGAKAFARGFVVAGPGKK